MLGGSWLQRHRGHVLLTGVIFATVLGVEAALLHRWFRLTAICLFIAWGCFLLRQERRRQKR